MCKYLISIMTAIALCFSCALVAKTPDGETPANEGICDELSGATPGLFGLCIAYCEAHDADLISEDGTGLNKPNEKLLANYRKKMKEGDPDMPCVSKGTECPCFTAAEVVNTILIQSPDVEQCTDFDRIIRFNEGYVYTESRDWTVIYGPRYFYLSSDNSTKSHGQLALSYGSFCQIYNTLCGESTCSDGSCFFRSIRYSDDDDLAAVQHEACQQELEDARVILGL